MLQDSLGRTIEYLRISVTDRCDLRCSYCLPRGFRGFCQPEACLTFDEIERIAGVFARLGVRRLRLTGGEPLTRRGIVSLAARLAALPGIADLSLSTNATRLGALAGPLREAGVSRLNVSLDTLDRQRYAGITGRDCLPAVLAGLARARAAGFAPIKINMVGLADTTHEELDAMVGYCIESGFVLRLIEPMPVGDTGRHARALDMAAAIHRLSAQFRLLPALVSGGGPARYLRSADGAFTIGFIAPLTRHFCDTCNRVRLAVDGTLHLCLGQENRVSLRTLLRQGVSDAALGAALRAAVRQKPARHEFNQRPGKIIRLMAQTGG